MCTSHFSKYGEDPWDNLDAQVCELLCGDETFWESPAYLVPLRGKEWGALGLRETDYDTIE